MEEFGKYLENFIGKPNPMFNNMPVCPFVHKANINYLTTDTVNKNEILQLLKQDEILIVIIKDISLQDLLKLESEIKIDGWLCFSGHPEHNFNVNGVYTRRDPAPNLQFIEEIKVIEARKILSKHYYEFWSDDNLLDISK